MRPELHSDGGAETRSTVDCPADDQGARVGGCRGDGTLRRDFHDRTRRRRRRCWIAEISALPGVVCYGQDRDEAVAGVQALALRMIAERLESREELLDVLCPDKAAIVNDELRSDQFGNPPRVSGNLGVRERAT